MILKRYIYIYYNIFNIYIEKKDFKNMKTSFFFNFILTNNYLHENNEILTTNTIITKIKK